MNSAVKTYDSQFNELACCVIIPTYNNAGTIRQVVQSVLYYTKNIILVNDGSTDETAGILAAFPSLECITNEKNCGKGYSLRKAIQLSDVLGYRSAITMDADGQHKVEDLLLFLEKIKMEPDAIIVGARNLSAENMPGKNSFANKFSNFWFRFETGLRLPDTQSGFRAYPVHLLAKKKYVTRKYEFELEVLVRAAWSSIKIISIPIQVYYPPASERVSHFRPFKDFFRISILNTLLVIIAVLIVKPFRFVKMLNKKNLKEFFQKHILRNKDSDAKITFSVMLGIFMGIAPFWGYQMGLALVLAMLFRLNKVLTLVASNISVPPMVPVIIYLSYLFGGFVYTKESVNVAYSPDLTLFDVQINLIQYLVGSFVFGIAMAIGFGAFTYILLKIFRKKRIRRGDANPTDSEII